MYNRYNLRASYKGIVVFDGDFLSLNKMIKFCCLFSDEVYFYAYDYLHDKSFTDTIIHNIMEDFKHGEIYI